MTNQPMCEAYSQALPVHSHTIVVKDTNTKLWQCRRVIRLHIHFSQTEMNIFIILHCLLKCIAYCKAITYQITCISKVYMFKLVCSFISVMVCSLRQKEVQKKKLLKKICLLYLSHQRVRFWQWGCTYHMQKDLEQICFNAQSVLWKNKLTL